MEKRKVTTWLSNHGEWASLMTTCVGLFVFGLIRSEKIGDRLDAHMIAINQRADTINQRSDELHKEFYDLLKELRRDERTQNKSRD